MPISSTAVQVIFQLRNGRSNREDFRPPRMEWIYTHCPFYEPKKGKNYWKRRCSLRDSRVQTVPFAEWTRKRISFYPLPADRWTLPRSISQKLAPALRRLLLVKLPKRRSENWKSSNDPQKKLTLTSKNQDRKGHHASASCSRTNLLRVSPGFSRAGKIQG